VGARRRLQRVIDVALRALLDRAYGPLHVCQTHHKAHRNEARTDAQALHRHPLVGTSGGVTMTRSWRSAEGLSFRRGPAATVSTELPGGMSFKGTRAAYP